MLTKTIPKQTQKTLELLGASKKITHFYLSGGTACALYLGHRISEDLDFFTQNEFSTALLRDALSDLGTLEVLSEDKNTLHAILNKTRISFIRYKYPLLDHSTKLFNVSISSLLDVLCTKLDTVSSRGSKKDFIDLYCAITQNNYTLKMALDAFQKKYASINYNLIHILKGLIYFEDADAEDMPRMIEAVSWDTVKQFFKKTVREIQYSVL